VPGGHHLPEAVSLDRQCVEHHSFQAEDYRTIRSRDALFERSNLESIQKKMTVAYLRGLGQDTNWTILHSCDEKQGCSWGLKQDSGLSARFGQSTGVLQHELPRGAQPATFVAQARAFRAFLRLVSFRPLSGTPGQLHVVQHQ
jgi:hypothetical protein